METMNASRLSVSLRATRGVPRGSIADYMVMALLLAFAYCTGAGDGTEANSRARPVSAGAPASLLLRLVVPQRTSAGQPVAMTLMLENQGEEEVEIGLGGQPIAFDFIVRDTQGREVWSRLEGVPIESILQLRTIGPGEVMEFTDVWDQRTNSGLPVEPGTYEVSGVLPVVDEPDGWQTDTETLRIEG
ncbi:MAG: hypothetical protein GEU90_02425 [Gemmatimonas sp.]|nr:hypothetical protein [Gemmatimonas sp.]